MAPDMHDVQDIKVNIQIQIVAITVKKDILSIYTHSVNESETLRV